MSFAHLPIELLLEQLQYLSIDDILQVCQTNQQFAQVCQGDPLWQMLLRRDFNTSASPRELYLCKINALRYKIETELEKADLLGDIEENNLIEIPSGERTDFESLINRDRQVWLDYAFVGTPAEIVDLLESHGINRVESGELYEMTDGQRGSPPGVYIVTEELIWENSLDMSDPQDQALLDYEISPRPSGPPMTQPQEAAGVPPQQIRAIIQRYPHTEAGFRQVVNNLVESFGLQRPIAIRLAIVNWNA
jgi:hypothetical protein